MMAAMAVAVRLVQTRTRNAEPHDARCRGRWVTLTLSVPTSRPDAFFDGTAKAEAVSPRSRRWNFAFRQVR